MISGFNILAPDSRVLATKMTEQHLVMTHLKLKWLKGKKKRKWYVCVCVCVH